MNIVVERQQGFGRVLGTQRRIKFTPVTWVVSGGAHPTADTVRSYGPYNNNGMHGTIICSLELYDNFDMFSCVRI